MTSFLLEPKYRERILWVVLFFLPHFIYSYLFITPFYSDFFSFYSMLSRFLYTLRSGHFPLWSPLMHGGMPSAYELSMTGGLSPLYWLVYARFPAAYTGDAISLLLHFKLFVLGAGGVFAFLFFKKISGSFWGALLGALTFMLNLRMLDNFRYASPLDVLCFLPLLFLTLEKMMESPRRRYGIFYSLSFGAMLLSGQLQFGVFNLMILAAYFFSRPKNGGVFWRVSVFSLLGLALASPLLLPLGLDTLGQLGQRASLSVTWTDSYRMSLPTLLANFGLPWFGDVHSSFYSSAASVFLLFLVLGILAGKRVTDPEKKRSLVFFFVFFIFCLLYSLGSQTWVSAIVNHCVPVLQFTRAPGRIMGAGVFCLSALVALSVGYFEALNARQDDAAAVFKKILAGVFIFLGLGGWAVMRFKDTLLPEFVDAYAPLNIHGSAGMAEAQGKWAAIFSLLGFLGVYGLLGKSRRSFTAGCLLLAGLILAEARVYHPQASWYAPKEKILSYDSFISLDTFHGRPSVLQPSGQGWPVDVKKNEVQIDAPKALGEFLLAGGPAAAELYASAGKEHLFFTNFYLVTDNLTEALKTRALGPDLRKITLIDKKDAGSLTSKPPRSGAEGGKAEFKILERTTDRIRFTVEAPEEGIVNYLDNYHPAFKAVLGGKAEKVLRTYGTFKGILVPQGKHEIIFHYDPLSFKLAQILFGAACAVLAALSLFQFQKRPKIFP